MRRHFQLDPALTFLNHGSFGACPRRVSRLQGELRARMEASPVQFMTVDLPRELRRQRQAVARFVGARECDLAFVQNATEGVNAVLRSVELHPGDELLTTNHAYAACHNALRFVAERSGARLCVVKVPFPIDGPEAVVEAIESGLGPRTRLVLVDHVTSITGLVLPVAEIARLLRSRDIRCLVDGAHAPGMLPLDVEALGVDYYAANFHKWVCSPRGAGMLWVRPGLQRSIYPTCVSHGFSASESERFQAMFDWTGTKDPTAWLCVADAIELLGSLLPGGWTELRQHNHRLVLGARDVLCNALGIAPPAPDEMLGALASLPLPASRAVAPADDPLYRDLVARGFEVLCMPFPAWPERVLRVSAQVYNDASEYERLAEVLPPLLGRG